MKPNVNHIDAWVFDLDNTLYPASSNLFAEIDRRMGEFIAAELRVDPPEARRIQKDYFRDFGTTLRGLMVNHAIEPELFLEYVHAIDVSILAPDPALDAALSRLDGMKIIFTNGSLGHAEKVMDRLGVARHFDAVFDIAAAEYLSKPDPAAYHALVRRHNLTPGATAIFEDLSRNLAPAAALGMTTVWVRNVTPWAEAKAAGGSPDYIHHETENLVAWLEEAIAARGPYPERR
ncbi:MAG TPA: pyrimidine 5'-nucleotidase [Alphaproteobacteria bacterium]|nr:pyrimidine 5'-nucleotidase [Alphaproteobacteria bacterium]